MESPHGAAVVAKGLGLKGPRGWAFRSVDLTAEPGSLVAIEGPSGSGRTCLLLALTGRMRVSEGHAEVAALQLPRKMAAVRRISALGPVPGVSDLDPALTVAEHLRERALLQRRFDGSLRALLRPRTERAAEARARIDGALEVAGLDLATLPKRERTPVRDLERLEELRLSVALALIGGPRLLAVDDTELKLSDADRDEAWALLRAIAAGGTTVLAVCSQAPEGATVVHTTEQAPAGTPADTAHFSGAADDALDADDTGTDGTDGTEEVRAAQAPEHADQAEPDHPADADEQADADERAGQAGPTGRDAEQSNHKDTTEEGAADALAETGRA
ncbi:ATP-binding cassette domain-containing protein [Streptomyces sp. NPDC018833]|uniref:ATP-binding cassette domain-containing protein n=1 Tax=Streptomyces sp. NPDC018833 TaxID=3365053 RepID=UPI00378DFC60